MIHYYGFVGIFLVTLIIAKISYTRNAEKLIVYHKYSIVIDALACSGGLFLGIMGFIFYGMIPSLNVALWFQVVIGFGLFNIHAVRFTIHMITKDKYHYSNKKRKYSQKKR